MSQTEFYSRISCSFGSVKKVHLVIFSDVSRSSKSQNSLISGCEIGTPWYTGCRLFFSCLLVSIAIFPMKHRMKPGLSQNQNGVTKPHGQAFVLRSSSGRNKPRVAAVEVLCHTSPPNETRNLTDWSTAGDENQQLVHMGIALKTAGVTMNQGAFFQVIGSRWAPTKVAIEHLNFTRIWVSWDISTAALVYQRVKLLLDWLDIDHPGDWFRSRNPAKKILEMIEMYVSPVMNHGINYALGTLNIAGWKMDPDWVDVFPIEHGDIPLLAMSVYQRLTKLSWFTGFQSSTFINRINWLDRMDFHQEWHQVVHRYQSHICRMGR